MDNVTAARIYRSRKISKYARKHGDAEVHLQDILQKPILTLRDKEVLLSVYHHRCLTTEQIAEIHFKYDTRGKVNSQASLIARRRLRKLFDYALVDRFFVDVGEGQGSSQAHVLLDSLGAKVVAGLLNLRMEEVDWRYEMNAARLPYLGHLVSINDFYLYLLRSAREHGHECTGFLTETHTRHEFTHWDSRIVFNPDAYGQYWMGSEGFHYFLEWDNGTMSPATFQKKHQRYVAFYDSEEYRKYYPTFPLVLTVTTTRERAATLAKSIRSKDSTDIVWMFCAAEDVKANGAETIWLDKHEKPVTLLG